MGPDPEAALVAVDGEAAAVGHQRGAVVHAGLDVAFDPLLGGGRHHRPEVRVLVQAVANLQVLDPVLQLGNQGVGGVLAHGNRHGDGHAAFPGGSVPRADQGVGSHVEVRVRHDHHVVLGAAEALGPLAVGGGGRVDVLGDRCGAHKADGLDALVLKQRIHGFLVAVDHVEDAVRHAGLGVELGQPERH